MSTSTSLSKRKQIRSIMSEGAAVRGRHFTVTAGVIPAVGKTESQPKLLAVGVPKSVGSAVARNRFKRRFRAVVGRQISRFPSGCGLVVTFRPNGVPFQELVDELAGLLGNLASQMAGKQNPLIRGRA